jgi:hypothetical protein
MGRNTEFAGRVCWKREPRYSKNHNGHKPENRPIDSMVRFVKLAPKTSKECRLSTKNQEMPLNSSLKRLSGFISSLGTNGFGSK